ncbi:MAG TPA: V-type ATP synthase subunit A [Gemmatimonadales bacterium]|nr:V-type ATP synthase subunit A [Gemmatimonadales bacterium]HRZ08421.1 V-type ATP synthase subunit A [Gemmatimonadales bacterium]
MTGARVVRAAGALVEASPLPQAALYEIVRVGRRRLLGEVIRIQGEVATVQVFEDTAGLALEEPVESTGAPLQAELGPGLLGSVLDGTGRPLSRLAEQEGNFLSTGTVATTLDRARRWEFTPSAKVGARLAAGDELGTVVENEGVVHRILVPPDVSGVLAELKAGSYSVEEEVGRLQDGTALRLLQRWPVRVPRPVARWLPADRPFVTGQRVFDFLFPVAEGGSVAVPGGFGTGKTVIEQSLAKHSMADIVVYVGCGERGNEMADVLEEFPTLEDPRTGRSLMNRTVLVVNTSNMPVAAREASVYLGLTIAEYYRDMGYRVALMADSLSRWAEALREIGSLLREMPGEEGYPTSLGNRLGKLFERAGRATALGAGGREGAVTFISALSPPGGDFSEPVTQAALRVAGALWALDASLAHQRQFPAVDWETSYSLQAADVMPWFEQHGGAEWTGLRRETFALLQRDRELREVAGLVGPDALEDQDRLILETARLLREFLIGQSAYDPADASSPVTKTWRLADTILRFHREGTAALAGGGTMATVDVGGVRRTLSALRASPEGTPT